MWHGGWVLTMKRDMNRDVERCHTLWVLHGVQHKQSWAQHMYSLSAARRSFRVASRHGTIQGWRLVNLDLKTEFFQGDYDAARDGVYKIPAEVGPNTMNWCTVEDTGLWHACCNTHMVEQVRILMAVIWVSNCVHRKMRPIDV